MPCTCYARSYMHLCPPDPTYTRQNPLIRSLSLLARPPHPKLTPKTPSNHQSNSNSNSNPLPKPHPHLTTPFPTTPFIPPFIPPFLFCTPALISPTASSQSRSTSPGIPYTGSAPVPFKLSVLPVVPLSPPPSSDAAAAARSSNLLLSAGFAGDAKNAKLASVPTTA